VRGTVDALQLFLGTVVVHVSGGLDVGRFGARQLQIVVFVKGIALNLE
jgi:hypothetical protein